MSASVLVEVHLLEEKIWWVVSLSVLAAGSALRAADAISHLLSGTGLDSCLRLLKQPYHLRSSHVTMWPSPKSLAYVFFTTMS